MHYVLQVRKSQMDHTSSKSVRQQRNVFRILNRSQSVTGRAALCFERPMRPHRAIRC